MTKYLGLLLCFLLVPSVAGAETEVRFADLRAEQKKAIRDAGFQTEVDRFLTEKVQPEIEAGTNQLNDSYSDDSTLEGMKIQSQRAIAHYLKALVLIEQEKLRRQK